MEKRDMNIVDSLQNVTLLFLDTAPVIYYVEENPSYLALVEVIFERIDNGSLTAVTSPVTLAECLVVPYRLGLMQRQRDFFDLIVHGSNTVFLPIDHDQARRAAELRVHHNLTLPDALQIAAALTVGCEAFLTNDATLKRVTELRVLVLNELEIAAQQG
jgi:predicted nucleic acid-binding protein